MPREDQHLDKAKKNERFAESLNRSDVIAGEWAVVAVFYAALHYVQAYFSKFSVEARCHHDRFDQIKRDQKIKTVITSYKYLYALSRTARYQCGSLPTDAYEKSKSYLADVKKHIEPVLRS